MTLINNDKNNNNNNNYNNNLIIISRYDYNLLIIKSLKPAPNSKGTT